MEMKRSACGRYVLLDGVYLDRNVFDGLAKWAEARGLRIQDALQLAVCAFCEHERSSSATSLTERVAT
jgi:hypothetical protein